MLDKAAPHQVARLFPQGVNAGTKGRLAFLLVFEDNKPALAFYEQLGFKRLRAMYLACYQL